MVRSVFLIVLAITQIGAARFPSYGSSRTASSAEIISMVALLARPAAYDGRRVEVQGCLILRFEDAALYLDRSAYEAGLSRNAVWIDPPRELMESRKARPFDGRYAVVVGRFVASERGHLGRYSGALTDVRYIAPVMTRAEAEARRQSTYSAALWRDPRIWLALALVFMIPAVAGAIYARRGS